MIISANTNRLKTQITAFVIQIIVLVKSCELYFEFVIFLYYFRFVSGSLWVIIGGYTALKEAFIQGGSVFAGRPCNMWKISQKKFHQYKDGEFG